MKTIIALDFENTEQSLDFINKIDIKNLEKYAKENGLKLEIPYLKIGMWQYFSEGNDFIKLVKDKGFKVFLDLKLIDIPNTIYNATKRLLKNDIDILSLHSFAGEEALKAAVLAKNELASRCKLFGISVLTSFSEKDFFAQFSKSISEAAKSSAKVCKNAGLDGLVSSVYEAKIAQESGLLTLCPGIRFKNNDANDQSRIASPKTAMQLGLDYIVAGRMITKSAEPIKAYFKCTQGEENE